MHYADVIEGYADRVPDAIALVHGETRRTWAEFEDRAAAWRAPCRAPGSAPVRRSGCSSTTAPSTTRPSSPR
jgi:3-oxocholest-4-en-26-oate---CoA ligase